VGRERGQELARRPHGSATTTPSVREAIQTSREKNTVLAKRYGVDRKTVAKWKGRTFSSDLQTRPKNPRSLTLEDEAIILAYRWRTRLSLDDSLVRLRRRMPQLTRSALYRCLERYGLSKIGRTNVSPSLTSVDLSGPYCFDITINHVDLGGLGVPVLLAVEEVTKHVYGQMVAATPENAVAFLDRLVAEFPQKIDAVSTYICPAFAHVREAFGEYIPTISPTRPHPFAVACSASGIVHKRTLFLPEARVSAETAQTNAQHSGCKPPVRAAWTVGSGKR
jgi:transposase